MLGIIAGAANITRLTSPPAASPTPVAHWPLDEASGATAVDAEGTRDAAIVGSPRLKAPPLVADGGASFELSGTGQHLVAPNFPELNGTSGTLVLYVNPDRTDRKQILAAKQGSFTAGAFSFEILPGGALRAWRVDGSNNLVELTSAAGLISAGRSYRLALSFGPRGLRVYAAAAGGGPSGGDGTVLSDPASDWGVGDTTGDLYLGSWVNGTSDPLDGLVDDVRFYDGQLSDAEVAALAAPRDASEALGDDAAVNEGGSVTIDVTSNDRVAGAVTAVAVASQPGRGSATVSGTSIVFDDAGNSGSGSTSFTYTFTDANGVSNAATVGVAISAVVPDNPRAFFRVGKRYPSADLAPVKEPSVLLAYYASPDLQSYPVYNVICDTQASSAARVAEWKARGELGIRPRYGKWNQIPGGLTEPPSVDDFYNHYNQPDAAGIIIDEIFVTDETGYNAVLGTTNLYLDTLFQALRRLKQDRPDYLIVLFWTDLYRNDAYKSAANPDGYRFGCPQILEDYQDAYDLGQCEVYVLEYNKPYRHMRVQSHAAGIKARGLEHKTIFALNTGEPDKFDPVDYETGDTQDWANQDLVREQIGYARQYLPEGPGCAVYVNSGVADAYDGSPYLAMNQSEVAAAYVDGAPTVAFDGPPTAVGTTHSFAATGTPNGSTGSAIRHYRWFVDNECVAITAGGAATLTMPAGSRKVTVHAVAADYLAGAAQITVTVS